MQIPPSKSESIRALIFSHLAKGSSISGLLEAFDIKNLENILANFSTTTFIDVGNSGLNFRFLTALTCLDNLPRLITGDLSIQTRRPILPLIQALERLGASITYLETEGYAPFIIQGPIKAGYTQVAGYDSQFVSSLLVALCQLEGESILEVIDPQETEYVNMTLKWFDRLKISYRREGYQRFWIQGRAKIEPFSYQVPLDFSSAAFPFAASQLLKIPFDSSQLDFSQPQCDKELFFILEKSTVDISLMPDLLPILCVLGTYGLGPKRLDHIEITRSKESDRPLAMKIELEKMGGCIEIIQDSLIIHPSPLKGAEVYSHHDHRIAMALVVAALKAEGATIIHEVCCIEKTYPQFFKNICPDWAAKIGQNNARSVTIEPLEPSFLRS